MARHHTKDKGDVGVACVIADLMKKGIGVARPLSEHQPYDLIACSQNGSNLIRLSVKYRRVIRGCLEVTLTSTWADRHGVHIVQHDKCDYDAIAIYNPDKDRCYYVRTNEIKGYTLTLRLVAPRNNQRKNIRMAKRFTDPHRIFGDRAAKKAG